MLGWTSSLFLLILVTLFVRYRYWLMQEVQRGLLLAQKGRGRAAVRALTLPALLGEKTAQETLAMIYCYGMGGVPVDDAQAVKWFERVGWNFAKDAGATPLAMNAYEVGEAYLLGTQVRKNPQLARGWLLRAQAGGCRRADVLLQQLEP